MFSFRLTSSLLLALLLASVAAKPAIEYSEPPATCPVTTPPSPAFVPPPPYPSHIAADQFWFGGEKLWTALPTNGTWTDLPHYRPTDTAFRQKLFWWSKGYDWHAENPPRLTVTGKRLDGLAPLLETDEHANNGWTTDRDHPFMVIGIDIPTAGCWQITGEHKGARLTFVVWVPAN
jgi:hypothetical protein